jgi:hypothetical protein
MNQDIMYYLYENNFRITHNYQSFFTKSLDSLMQFFTSKIC